jgi:hypothetical protein
MLHYLIRFLGWSFGLRFVPYNYVKPVLRWGRFRRWGSGFFWIIPLVEQTLKPIDTGVCKALLRFYTVMSQDNIPFEFYVTVLFAFKPDDQIPYKELADRLVHLSQEQRLEPVLKSMIQDHLSERLRNLVATIKAEEMCHDSTRIHIKHDLIHYLTMRLHDMGLHLIGEGILIQEIMVPEKFQRIMLDVEQHNVILRKLNEYRDQPVLIDKAVQAELMDSLEERKGDLSIGAYLDLDYLHYPRRRKSGE